jgi:multidrug efflux system membrane fusion protein
LAKKGAIGVYIQALGTVTPLASINVVPRVQGQITQVLYKEGQLVKKGQPLIEIDARPYEAVAQQAAGALKRDEALLKEAQIDLKRYQLAYKHRAISKQQLDDQEQLVRQNQGAVEADRGTLEMARLNVEYCHIVSPLDGRIGLRLVDPGNMIQANSTTALATITQLNPITVIFSVAEDHVPAIMKQLQENQAMKVDAYDRAQKNLIASGEFSTLDNQIDTTTGTVRVRASFENEKGALFPFQFVNTRLLLTTEKDTTIVGTKSIQRGSKGTFVYVVRPDKTVAMKKIEVGTTDGDETSVKGLEPGEVIATTGFDKLQDGASVNVRDTQMAGQAAGKTAPSPSPSPEPSARPSP